jgi:hypothetical protein
MKRVTTKTASLVVITMLSIVLLSGNALALNWTYSYDAYNDASGGNTYEIYRMGYAFDENSLHVNMLTGLPQTGGQSGSAIVNAGDLFLNIGGHLKDGYTPTGNAYASGEVFGLALTDHSGDMNEDLSVYGWASSGTEDDGYAWSAVTQGHLYSDAFFSTGVYEGYAHANDAGNADGTDPFGGANNAPSHITSFEQDFGSQGAVTWTALADGVALNQSGSVKTSGSRKAYEVSAQISLDSLGIIGGESFELWWSMECGNDIAMIAGTMPEQPVATPEPGTLLLVGSGLLGGMALLRRRRS